MGPANSQDDRIGPVVERSMRPTHAPQEAGTECYLLMALTIDGLMGEIAASAFRRHYNEIFRFVRRRTGSDYEAEEITQSVFVQAAASLDPGKQGTTPLLAWLLTVARRRLIDEARRRARHGMTVPLAEAQWASKEQSYGNEVATALQKALASLSPVNRDVVVLRLVQGRSFLEIARRLDSTEPACKMRFLRGLSQVRDAFEKEGIKP